jgi:hypothetical protein
MNDGQNLSDDAGVGIVESNSGKAGIRPAFTHIGIQIGELPVLLHETELPLEIFGGDGVETGLFIDVMVHQDHSVGLLKKEKSGRERT